LSISVGSSSGARELLTRFDTGHFCSRSSAAGLLAVLLILAERQQLIAAQRLVDVRNILAETIKQVDAMMLEETSRVNARAGGSILPPVVVHFSCESVPTEFSIRQTQGQYHGKESKEGNEKESEEEVILDFDVRRRRNVRCDVSVRRLDTSSRPFLAPFAF
jgi:hypothetical protein